MPIPTLHELVRDWGGFERLVATLHRTGTVRVEHNAVIIGKSGAPRQCDVVIRHREGLYEHLIIVECKLWQKNVSRLHVDALATSVRDLNASRGVIMTAKGFQSGAETAAKHEGIDLFLVRDLADDEWGAPGRVVSLIFQFISRAIGNIQFHGARAIAFSSAAATPSMHLALHLGGPTQSHIPMLKPDGTPTGSSLEQLLTESSLEALQQLTAPTFTINGGEDCTRYMQGAVVIAPPSPLVMKHGDVVIMVDKITFDLAIKYHQWNYSFDRGDSYVFALAVEDRISRVVSAASQRAGDDVTRLAPLKSQSGDKPDALVNGSVAKVWLSDWFPFEELNGLTPVPGPRLPSGSP